MYLCRFSFLYLINLESFVFVLACSLREGHPETSSICHSFLEVLAVCYASPYLVFAFGLALL